MRALVAGALETARGAGASMMQVTPVLPDENSYRFMGNVPFFESLGFKEIGTAGQKRHVMRLPLG